MGLAFSRLWFGNHGFGEHATLQEFQHRFLISTLLIGVFCTAIYSLLTLGMNIPKAGWLRVYGILLAAVMLGLWAWLRIHPERFRSVACSSMALNFSVLVINTWLNPFDPLFFLWLFSTLLPAFVLLGRAAGWVVTALAVACVGLANTFVHRHFSAVSMQTIVLTTLC